jgi:hypothetical protein
MAKKLDSDDPRDADALMRKFFPHRETWRVVSGVLADAVVEANTYSPAKWGTTMRADFIRLNLGRVQVVTIGRELLHLLVREDRLPEKLPAHWVLAAGHLSVPEACAVQISAPTIADWTHIRPAWSEAARLAADTPMHNMTKPSHAAGVLEFLRTATGREIPRPSWAA